MNKKDYIRIEKNDLISIKSRVICAIDAILKNKPKISRSAGKKYSVPVTSYEQAVLENLIKLKNSNISIIDGVPMLVNNETKEVFSKQEYMNQIRLAYR